MVRQYNQNRRLNKSIGAFILTKISRTPKKVDLSSSWSLEFSREKLKSKESKKKSKDSEKDCWKNKKSENCNNNKENKNNDICRDRERGRWPKLKKDSSNSYWPTTIIM